MAVSRNDRIALREAISLHSTILLSDNPSAESEVAAVKFFHDICTRERGFPAYFKMSLIGLFVKVGRDAQRAIGIRMDSLFMVLHLFSVASKGNRHLMLDQGVLALFVDCVDSNDDRLREKGMEGVTRALSCCLRCTIYTRGYSTQEVTQSLIDVWQRYPNDAVLCEIALHNLLRFASHNLRYDMIDRIVMTPALLQQLLNIVRAKETRTSAAHDVLWEMLKSFTKYPRDFSSFLGYGCLPVIIEECGTWDTIDERGRVLPWVRELSQMVRTVLTLHPEWWPAVEKTGCVQWLQLGYPPRVRPKGEYVIIDEEAMDF